MSGFAGFAVVVEITRLNTSEFLYYLGELYGNELAFSFVSAELTMSISALKEDLMRISQWCCKNSLLINPDKTKVLAIGVPQLLQKLSSFSITLFDKLNELTPVPVVKDLGVILDTCLSYNEHITKTASNCLFKLQQINRIKHLLDRRTLLLVINSFVLGRVRLGSIRNKNNWNNASKRLFGSYSHSGIPGFPFRLFYSQEQNSRNIFRNIFRNKFFFRNIPNERALSKLQYCSTV